MSAVWCADDTYFKELYCLNESNLVVDRPDEEKAPQIKRIGRINGMFWHVRRVPGRLSIGRDPRVVQTGNRVFRAERLRSGTLKDGPLPLGCRRALSAGVFDTFDSPRGRSVQDSV